ncbi:hypothetical protein HNQ35_001251 [Cerasibacillus quisquiliarum]|uniref:Uncharacterized protein n=1 Tax=Cerasibacillus quisquiliarum TaxID=227865 RepID=A0A511V2A3_9BACI|nr:hypothetical protein [Cerasibacillus quisquiliarum]GEN32171.1 hypothetical protein CQU01_24090 [Cerasibacillus quisquiliarum]
MITVYQVSLRFGDKKLFENARTLLRGLGQMELGNQHFHKYY